LGLVVQNRRFLVLSETRMPNLASRALGLSVRAPPGHWEDKHGYKPVLAETFTGIQGATITADALHCERESMRLVVENGGDFLFQLKNNQPTAFGAAGKIAASASPFHPLQKREPQRQSRHTERGAHRPQSPPRSREILAIHPGAFLHENLASLQHDLQKPL
ncbi:MAG: hypothetical protein M0Q93_02440, partial [Terrimicrobiaceae bacterium]|nr:hypothetical protein [Terrimicrobiaceae bacterium]